MKILPRFLLILTTIVFSCAINYGQTSFCPVVDAGNNITLDCNNSSATLTVDFVRTGLTTSYDVSSIAYNPPFPYRGPGSPTNPISVGLVMSGLMLLTCRLIFAFLNGSMIIFR